MWSGSRWIVGRDHSLQCNWMQRDMNEHEEIAKALKARLSELRTHLAKVDRSLRKPLPADSEDQAIELENQEALEVIEKTETTEIHQIEAALANIRGHIWYLRQVRRAYRPKTPEGAANSSYVHFLFGLIFKHEATTEQGHRSRGPNDTARRADEVIVTLGHVGLWHKADLARCLHTCPLLGRSGHRAKPLPALVRR